MQDTVHPNVAMRPRARLRALAVLVVAVVACWLAAAPAAPAQSAERDIVETATSAGQFKTLSSLLKRAGLADDLQQPGPYTVFAPTDAAFAKVPKRTLAALARDRAQLRSVLLYHVVEGRVTAQDVVKLSSAKTLNGKALRIRTPGEQVRVNRATITTPDVLASNGVVHVINRVLIPPGR